MHYWWYLYTRNLFLCEYRRRRKVDTHTTSLPSYTFYFLFSYVQDREEFFLLSEHRLGHPGADKDGSTKNSLVLAPVAETTGQSSLGSHAEEGVCGLQVPSERHCHCKNALLPTAITKTAKARPQALDNFIFVSKKHTIFSRKTW